MMLMLSYFPVSFIKTCCGYSFELPRFVEAIQRRTHNMFYKENRKIILHLCFYKEVDKSTLVVI